MPILRKHELREMFTTIKKRFADEDKALKAKESKEVFNIDLIIGD